MWDVLLYSDSRFDESKSKSITWATIDYMKNSEWFSGSNFE